MCLVAKLSMVLIFGFRDFEIKDLVVACYSPIFYVIYRIGGEVALIIYTGCRLFYIIIRVFLGYCHWFLVSISKNATSQKKEKKQEC